MNIFLSLLLFIATTATLQAQVLPDQSEAGRLSPAQREQLSKRSTQSQYTDLTAPDNSALNEALKLQTLSTATIIDVLEPHLNLLSTRRNDAVLKQAIDAKNRLASYPNNSPDVVSLLTIFEISFNLLKAESSSNAFGKTQTINAYLTQLDRHISNDASTTNTKIYLHLVRALTTTNLPASYNRETQTLADLQKVQQNLATAALNQQTQTLIDSNIERLIEQSTSPKQT